MHILGLSAGSVKGNSEILLKAALSAASGTDRSITTSWIHVPSVSIPMNPRALETTIDVTNNGLNNTGHSSNQVRVPDDRQAVLDAVLDADAYLIVAPTYMHQAPGTLKNLFDRIGGPYTDRGFAELILRGRAAGDPKWKDAKFDPRLDKSRVAAFICFGGSVTEDQFTMTLPTVYSCVYSLHAKAVDQIYGTGIAGPGSVLAQPQFMERAKQLGRNLVSQIGKTFETARYLGDHEPGSCPNCHLPKMEFLPKNGKNAIGCVTCGAWGRLVAQPDGKILASWDEDSIWTCITMKGKVKHSEDVIRSSIAGKAQVTSTQAEKQRWLDLNARKYPSHYLNSANEAGMQGIRLNYNLIQHTAHWATTFRVTICGLTIFLDAWLERPSCLDQYLSIEDVAEADYIFISHAHFDHIAGADRLSKRTGAMIVGNGEAIQVMRKAGVAEANLIPVSGGERVPLFTRAVREAARRGEGLMDDGPPAAPKIPHPSLAALTVEVWPSLHAVMPTMNHSKIPKTMDSGQVYIGAHSHACTLEITRGMTYGLLGLADVSDLTLQKMDSDLQSFVHWIRNKDNRISGFDGGQLMYHFLVPEGPSLLCNSHLGGYEGILRGITKRPTVAILGIAGRGNLNGRPYDGSAADFVRSEVGWLEEPEKVIWCLHDRGPLNPKIMDVTAATKKIEEETKSKVWTLEPGKTYPLFDKVSESASG
ncbi:hypothetical protein ACKAV7_013097 [Fusarium commune]